MKKDPRNEAVRERIRNRIEEMVKKHGWSQSELARRLSIERQAVSKWLTLREQIPNEFNMLELAGVLGTSVSYLFGETDDPRPAPDWHAGKGPSSAAEVAKVEAAALLRLALEKLEGPSRE